MRCVHVLLPDPRGGFRGVRRNDKREEFRFKPAYLPPLLSISSPWKEVGRDYGKNWTIFLVKERSNMATPDRENETDPFSR